MDPSDKVTVKKKGAVKKPAKSKKTKKPKKKKDPFGTVRLLKGSLLYQTKEFFENSTLHGVRYIAEEGRPFFERFMWFSFVATGAVAAIVIIFSLWEKFQTNPTITGLDTDFHNQEVIFPTVMVCPEVPYDEKQVSEVALVTLANYEAGSEQYEPFLKLLTQMSYGVLDKLVALGSNISDTNGLVMKSLQNLRKLVFKMAIGCTKTFVDCRYKDEPIDCCAYFKQVYSEHGFCYSFNARYVSNQDVEERTTKVNFLYETDKKWGLTFKPSRRSHIFVHSYNEISGWDFRPHVEWEENFAIDFLISMKETYTTEDARQLSTGQRKCIFPDEVKLKYYWDDYTFSGCMKECRMQKCLQYCKCIPPFYAPPVSLPSCTVKELACLDKYVANITSISGCQDCELGCHNTVYDIEKYSKSLISDGNKDAVVTIEYLTWPIIRYKREVLFGWVDLLVSFGGIAGLFLGFSLLSGVEIIYFFTMRACCMLYKNRDELIAIEQKQLKQPQHRYDLSLKPDLGNRIQASTPPEPQPEGLTKRSFNNKQVITVGLIQQEFEAVKIPNSKGLILAGPAKPYMSRYERIANLARPNQFRRIMVAPYSERIKPLENNVIVDPGGLVYNGYLP
ncbi:sodium channel protein Nach [Aedes aegypti]|uniref:Uncharacterized protein n=1 Tax=Aedes aegypti TaxID=7159 RepID=A0A1S4G155_AEDAE|nr:sodium channel protein Nach [Aedes aegypti]